MVFICGHKQCKYVHVSVLLFPSKKHYCGLLNFIMRAGEWVKLAFFLFVFPFVGLNGYKKEFHYPHTIRYLHVKKYLRIEISKVPALIYSMIKKISPLSRFQNICPKYLEYPAKPEILG